MKSKQSNILLTLLFAVATMNGVSKRAYSVSFEECRFQVRLIQTNLTDDATAIEKIEVRLTSVGRPEHWSCPFDYSIGEVFSIDGRIEYTNPISSFRSGAELQLKYENYPTKWKNWFVVEKLWRVLSVDYQPVSDSATPIIVLGEVVKPGEYMVENRGLLNALDKAGGFTDRGYRMVQVGGQSSHSSSGKFSFRFDVSELLSDTKRDLWIPPGWRITVPNPFFGVPTSVYNPKIKEYLLARNRQKEPEYNMELMRYYSDN